MLIWIVGCAIALAPLLAGMLSLHRLKRRSMPLNHGPLMAPARRVAERIGVSRRVHLLSNEQRTMPMLWGILRPKVLLPATSTEWSDDRVEAVLLHEFAHVRRWDCATQLLARLVCALYWYHPLVWWAARRLKAESELACDDLVLNAGCGAPDYAEHLLQVAAGTRVGLPLGSAAIGMAWRSRLEIRLRAILDDGRTRHGPSYASAAGCWCLVAGFALPLAAMRSEPATAPRLEPVVAGSAADENPFAKPVADAAELGSLPVRLGYVDNTAEGKQSIAAGGHAVKFRRPADAKYLMAIEMFASRYGHDQPPAEDFHVYILDEKGKLIQAVPYPYSQIEWGFARWYTLRIPALEVPRQFTIALAFNPHQTKGIFVGLDRSVKKSHSFRGRPTTGFEPVGEKYDWMIRAILVDETPKENPFASH
jgi:hypothetical protein